MMKSTISCDNGRINIFDDARFTTAQPFSSNVILTIYALRLDCLEQTDFWLCVHRYNIIPDLTQTDSKESTPKTSRNHGW